MQACPICGSGSKNEFVSKWGFQILKCKSTVCGHLYVKNFINEQGVMNREKALNEIDEIAKRLQSDFRDRNERLINTWESRGFVHRTTRLLEVGSGTGHILKSVKDRFPDISITSVEPSKSLQLYLNKLGFNPVSELEQVQEQFDSIILMEVIEHVCDPVSLMKQLKSYLKQDGKIFLTTPCGQLHDGRRNKMAFEERTHVHFFTEASLQLTCQKAGLNPIKLEFIEAVYLKPAEPVELKSKIKYHIKQILRIEPEISQNRINREGFRHFSGFISIS
jgi:2-polyprenyl-3-methyl-5-hydroxy-6-metoxy-1,4-benzoquinol methylase